jgi:hypothetical protein
VIPRVLLSDLRELFDHNITHAHSLSLIVIPAQLKFNSDTPHLVARNFKQDF